jgi:hypothetical protein
MVILFLDLGSLLKNHWLGPNALEQLFGSVLFLLQDGLFVVMSTAAPPYHQRALDLYTPEGRTVNKFIQGNSAAKEVDLLLDLLPRCRAAKSV